MPEAVLEASRQNMTRLQHATIRRLARRELFVSICLAFIFTTQTVDGSSIQERKHRVLPGVEDAKGCHNHPREQQKSAMKEIKILVFVTYLSRPAEKERQACHAVAKCGYFR